MKEFKTITNARILNLALGHLLELKEREERRNKDHKSEYGKDSRIALHHIDKYNEQIDEIHAEILIEEEKERDTWEILA